MKVLFVAEVEWDSVFQIGEHYYAKYFIEDGHDVMWLLNYWHPLSWKTEDMEQFKHKFILWKNKGMKPLKNLSTYAPCTIFPFGKRNSIFDNAFTAKYSIDLTFPNLTNYLKKKKWHKVDLLWIRNLKMAYLVNRISYRKLIYRITDDIANLSQAPKYFPKMQAMILKKADVVVVSTKNLHSYAKTYCNNVVYLPNGVDYDLFNKRELDEPDEIREIPHPRVIYVGNLSEQWTDLDLIMKTAIKLPDYSFIIIGNSSGELLSRLGKVKNIFILGKRCHSYVPSYLRNSDVGIMPFKKITFTEGVNPIKLYEYLAAGLPVVSVDLKEIRNIEAPIYLSDSTIKFAEMIVTAYNKGKNKSEFLEFAKDNSWCARYKAIQKIIMGL
jgi:glycosyltransferase involved in cell wall biosynthesis